MASEPTETTAPAKPVARPLCASRRPMPVVLPANVGSLRARAIITMSKTASLAQVDKLIIPA